jgi:hypothetical protein
MASHGPITDRIAKPTPEDVRAARESAGMTPDQAGEQVSGAKLPRRTWEKWEKPTETDNYREIPLATWELFLLMTDQHPTLRVTKRRGE